MPLPLVVLGAVAAAGYLLYRRGTAPPGAPEGGAEDPEAWPALLARAAREGDWAEVARLHLRLAELARGEVRSAHLLEAARLYEDPLGDAERAIRCYEEVLLVNPRESEAIAGLDFLRG